jgi:hypothetical protein
MHASMAVTTDFFSAQFLDSFLAYNIQTRVIHWSGRSFLLFAFVPCPHTCWFASLSAASVLKVDDDFKRRVPEFPSGVGGGMTQQRSVLSTAAQAVFVSQVKPRQPYQRSRALASIT